MTKRIISITLILLMIVMTGCKKTDVELQKSTENFVVDNSTVQKTEENKRAGKLTAGAGGCSVTLADQTVKKLTFGKAEKLYDTYFDESKNELRFSAQGDLTGYTVARKNADLMAQKNPITQAQAESAAMEHISNTYGDILGGYILERCDVDYNEYDLLYVKHYGTDDFVKGESCLVSVYFNGTVRWSSTIHVDDYVSFDETLLNGITEESLETYAQQQATTAYGDSLQECQVTGIWLQELEDGYALSVQAQVSYNEGGEPLSVAEEYIYPLS